MAPATKAKPASISQNDPETFADTITDKAVASRNVNVITSTLFYFMGDHPELHKMNDTKFGDDYGRLVDAIAKKSPLAAIKAVHKNLSLSHGVSHRDQVNTILPLISRALDEKGGPEAVAKIIGNYLEDGLYLGRYPQKDIALALVLPNVLMAWYRSHPAEARAQAITWKRSSGEWTLSSTAERFLDSLPRAKPSPGNALKN